MKNKTYLCGLNNNIMANFLSFFDLNTKETIYLNTSLIVKISGNCSDSSIVHTVNEIIKVSGNALTNYSRLVRKS